MPVSKYKYIKNIKRFSPHLTCRLRFISLQFHFNFFQFHFSHTHTLININTISTISIPSKTYTTHNITESISLKCKNMRRPLKLPCNNNKYQDPFQQLPDDVVLLILTKLSSTSSSPPHFLNVLLT
jgi:hypothetical protein